MDQAPEDWSPHSAHWGAFSARWNGATLDIKPYAEDPAPSSILQNFTTAMRHKARILRPMVRKAWLVQRRTFPPCAEPGSSLSEHGVRRLCAFGEQLQRRRFGRDPAACDGRL